MIFIVKLRLIKLVYINHNFGFRVFFTLAIISILFTNPFLRFPYDMFYHLLEINQFYITTDIPTDRMLWHFIWAKIFYLFGIDNTELFLRANIIHISQTYIAFFSVFFFAKVAIRNIFKQVGNNEQNYLALWSTIIWFSIYATFSMYYHQVWNMWYSVNYQITLPLFWYILALTIILLFEKKIFKTKLLILVQIIIFSFFIIIIHAMEFLYYLMYLSVLIILFINKRNIKYILGVTIGTTLFVAIFLGESLKYERYFSSTETIMQMLRDINFCGEKLLEGLNRAQYSINELIYLSLFALGIMLLDIILKKYNKDAINTKMTILLFISSLFVLIPLVKYIAGTFAVITSMYVVNRVYYSSSLFLVLPVVVYYFISRYSNKYMILKLNIIMVILILGIYFVSKKTNFFNNNYYKNIQSMKNSFYRDRVGFHLNNINIQEILKKAELYEKHNQTGKPIMFFARTDISLVLEYIHLKNVYKGYRKDIKADPNYDYKKAFSEASVNNNEFNNILFELPENLPGYLPYH